MLISVFTPTNNDKWLNEAYQSLLRQKYDNWEWVIVINPPLNVLTDEIARNPKVRILSCALNKIGALKKNACDACKGDIFVELDHDDLLTDNCLSAIAERYKNNGDNQYGTFYYSDCADWYDGIEPRPYSVEFGWKTYGWNYNGKSYHVHKNFDITARSLCEIFYAPNHVRAWTRKAYEASGGYDPTLSIGDDHDLMCRTYLNHSKFVNLNDVLYVYRHHGLNTSNISNDDVQKQQTDNTNKYTYQLINEWCNRNNYPKVDLGSAHNKPNGFLGVDLLKVPGVDYVCDVTKGLPFDDNSVGCIRAVDFLEHMPLGSLPQVFNEIYRVLVPGGWFISKTPSTDGRGAFQDPTHTSFLNSNSFWYYTKREFAKYVDSIKCRFQSVRLWNDQPNQHCVNHNIVYVNADLCALKGQRQPGLCLI